MLFESPVFWQCCLAFLGGFLVSWWVHVLIAVPRSLLENASI